jgi:uroporphyrin-III C-methyltransferase/precorrin-2 dehydrogenase/sirohydrochlorin ferrochelatase
LRLIIAATDDEPLNAQVSSDAHRRCVPVNVVDAPQLCSVIFPAIVDRSPLIIAVSSGGDAPVLARLIRAKIETWIPSTYGQLAGLAARFRNQVKNLFPDVQQRRGFWEDVFQARLPTGNWPGRAPRPSVCCRPRLMATHHHR